ncbi:MAG: hypothetical protein AB2L12_18160 [Smithellaceae bacterium]
MARDGGDVRETIQREPDKRYAGGGRVEFVVGLFDDKPLHGFHLPSEFYDEIHNKISKEHPLLMNKKNKTEYLFPRIRVILNFT